MKADDRGVAYVRPGEGKLSRVFEEVVTRKVASERTGGAYSLFEVVARPRGGVPPQIHHREDECFYVLEGEFEFLVEGRAKRARAGSLLYVPKGTLHAHKNVGEGVGRMLVSQTPGGSYERFFEEIGEDTTSDIVPSFEDGSPEATRIAKFAADYGIELALYEDGRTAEESDPTGVAR